MAKALKMYPAKTSSQLARQMLARLRQRTIDGLRLYAESPEELGAAAEKAAADVRVPADKASDAVRLAHCLAQQYPDIADLADTRAFVTIDTQTSDDARVVGDVLADVLAAKEGGSARIHLTSISEMRTAMSSWRRSMVGNRGHGLRLSRKPRRGDCRSSASRQRAASCLRP